MPFAKTQSGRYVRRTMRITRDAADTVLVRGVARRVPRPNFRRGPQQRVQRLEWGQLGSGLGEGLQQLFGGDVAYEGRVAHISRANRPRGAPLLAVFEKWGFPGTLRDLGFRACERRAFADFHLEHRPVIYPNWASFPEGVGAETTPPPLLRALHQSPPHRVAMNVA